MLPYKTWEWLAPTVLLTAWLVVPVVTVELFLSGIHNEVKQNLLKSKTTMKRMKSNVRRAREFNESDEEDLDIDVHEVSLCMTLVSPAPNTQTSNIKYQINTLLLTTTTTTTTMTDWLFTRAGGEGRRTGVRAQGRGGRGGRRGVY